MDIVAIIVFSVVGWWLILFITLPFGVKTHEESGVEPQRGSHLSVPYKSNIKMKLIITTIITFVMFLLLLLARSYGFINWRAWFDQAL